MSDSLTQADLVGRRRAREHVLQRASQRRLGLDIEAIQRLERICHAAMPLFERRGKHRYRLIVRLGGGPRITLIYDASIGAVLTAWAEDR